MQSNTLTFPSLEAEVETRSEKLSASDYAQAELEFIQLLEAADLDENLGSLSPVITSFETVLEAALKAAYQGTSNTDAAHLFVQRILYRINRLKLFWYDDLRRYTNERSAYLRQIRDRIEAVWQPWELAQLDVTALQQVDAKQALLERAAADLDPALSADSRFLREQMTEIGYQRLLAIASFDGLVEASRLSRILG
ncbi:MAG TPA: hypothetical protein V6D03_09130, partial [Candidatus Caenarcaniphilales bacterium]